MKRNEIHCLLATSLSLSLSHATSSSDCEEKKPKCWFVGLLLVCFGSWLELFVSISISFHSQTKALQERVSERE